MNPPTHRSLTIPTILGTAAALALTATPAVSATVTLGPQTWQTTNQVGLIPVGPTTIRSLPGYHPAGEYAGFTWCTPYRGTSIVGSHVVSYRYHKPTTARIEVSGQPDGSLGRTAPESHLPTGQPGRLDDLAPLTSRCVGARVRQTGSQDVAYHRIWDLVLQNVVLSDDQGPSVDTVRVDGPQRSGWFTGLVTVTWTSADNDFYRGTTGASIGSAAQDKGDPADGQAVQAVLDPGPDGIRTVRAWRTGGGGWATAERTTEIRVDRTPPSIPTVIAVPEARGTGPITIAGDAAVDAPGGSGHDRYEYTTDEGRTLLTAASITRPGTYRVRARAIDRAGNTSDWSLPLTVQVTGRGSASSAGDGAPPAPAIGSAAPRVIELGASRPRMRTRKQNHIQLRPVWGRRTIVTGRVSIGGVSLTLFGPRGRPVGTTTARRDGHFRISFLPTRTGTFTLRTATANAPIGRAYVVVRPLLRIDPRHIAQRDGQRATVALAPGRRIAISGTAAPRGLVTGHRIQLQYRSGPSWLPLGSPALIGQRGHWTVTYKIARPGTALVLIRGALLAQRGVGFATTATAPVWLRIE